MAIDGKTVTACDPKVQGDVNALLSGTGILRIGDISAGMSEARADGAEARAEATFGWDITNLKSAMAISLPPEVPGQPLVEALRALPAVRLAARTVVNQVGSVN